MRYVITLIASGILAAGNFQPARLANGSAEIVESPTTAGGGEVLLELEVAPSGEVEGVHVLRTTPPYGDLLRSAVANWRFEPAREPREGAELPVAVPSKVLVGGVFRNPALYNAPALGEVPSDIARPSPETPFPTALVPPVYPPNAAVHVSQTVLVEVEIGTKGEVLGSKVIGRGDGLAGSALDAAKRWRFRPARSGGTAVPSFAYLVFGFREPIVTNP
jgi:outer membrane biosynthesis protein TonB